jgi:4-oxalocrotonate tautomerase
MPVVIIHMLAGRSAGAKKLLIRKVTAAVASTLAADPESVRVIIQEMAGEHYGIAGLPVEEYRARKAEAKKNPAKRHAGK